MVEFFALFHNSLIALVLLSIAIALAGSLMMINRYGYLAAAIAHGSYGGVGMALFFGISILAGTTIFALVLALFLAFITYKNPSRHDVLIGVLWALGMSIGIIFIDLTPGYQSDLLAYLFGNILMIGDEDLWYMMGVDLLLIAAFFLLFNHFLAVAYDRDFAFTRGVPVFFIHTLTLLLIALTVVMSIRAIGLILVIALFSIPPFIAEKITTSFKASIFVSAILALLFGLVGLYIAYLFDISATASIILVASLAIFITLWRRV